MATYEDVPHWLRPSEVQENTPHALYIDFVQFPRLRDAMVLGQVSIDGIRDAFEDAFGRYISISWPETGKLFAVDDMCDTVVNPEFELHVCTLENWTLHADFLKEYPRLEGLVPIRGDERMRMGTDLFT